MLISLFSRSHVPIKFSSSIPSRLKSLVIEQAAVQYAQDGPNEFLCQEIVRKDFTLRFISFFLHQPYTYFMETPGDPVLQISMYGALQYELSYFPGDITVYHRHFNLFFSPSMRFRYKPERFGGSFQLCEIWPSLTYLQQLGKKHERAAIFLQGVEKGQPTMLFEWSQIANVEVMALLDLIGMHSGAHEWIDVYVNEIFEKLFESQATIKKIRINPAIILKVYQAADWLMEKEERNDQIGLVAGSLELSPAALSKAANEFKWKMQFDKWTEEDLADFLAISLFQLNKGFKKLYNCTLKEFRRELNWQIALNMIISKSANLKRISSFSGYGSQRSFSRAFKRRFCKTPVEYAQVFEQKFQKFKNSVYRNTGEDLGGHL